MRVSVVAVWSVLLAVAGPPRRALADSVRSAVANQLATELPAKDDTLPDSALAVGGTSAASDAGASEAAPAPEIDSPSPAAAPPSVATHPRRQVLGRDVYLDLSVESRMQVWLPAQHPSVHLAATPLRTWSLEVSGGIAGVVSLHRLAFETDGTSWFWTSGAAVAPSLGSGDVGAAAALAMLGLPFLRFGSAADWWEPIVRYEVSSYSTTATPSAPVCLVARDADTSANPTACTRTGGPLRMASRFESMVMGVQFGRPGGPGSAYAGVDLVRQRKPYQVNVDGRTLDDYLFDARFGGAGVALGFTAGRDQGLSLRGGVHAGAAWVSLADDLELGDVLPADWTLQYLRWDTTLAYGLVLRKASPSLLARAAVDASGSHFIYSRNDDGDTPSLSRDLFIGGRLALVMAF